MYMKRSMRAVALVMALVLATRADAQRARVTVSGGEVSRVDSGRLSARIPGVEAELRGRVRVDGDSAQRIALTDFDWRGRVSSVEIDEEDSRVFWDVKIIPDTSRQTIVRYRIDAGSGGIIGIKEFSGVRGLKITKP
jgi:uncharacterized membrane protein YkoI